MSDPPGSPSSKEKAAQLKLKEPRDLYSTTTLLHPIKWPVECQVIPEKIRHIDEPPSKYEPYYVPTGKEPQPQPVGAEMGTVVYDYQPKLSVDFFCRATIGGSQELQVFENSETNSLRFESRFESGNLARAIKVTNLYYELYLRPDMYTDRHAQWFYFRIQNTRENLQYRFSIVNFNKPDSLYRYGLKILMYSEKEAQLYNVGWVRGGGNIAYFKNDISLDDNGPYYTLTFTVKFKHNNDTVYFAQSYPYTYSTLQNYLKSIEDDEFKSQLLTIRLLCRSLAGNNVHILTVTSPDNHQQQEDTTNKKPVVVISARVHPGETQSSYMMKGIIDFLTSGSSQAKELRDRFIFKLIPMLNPDGVIVGNSRCCLLGQDLNRQYRTVLREAFPQIYHIKTMLRRLQEENGIFLYCDLHGHSRRHNVFIYGCENRRLPERKLLEQVFPLMMHKNAADKFSFQNCKFKIQKNKEGTGRIFVWTLGVVNSYTLEISLGGSTMPSRQCTHFNTGDYEACGRHFCETLLDYSDPNPVKESLRDRILQKLLDGGSTADEPKNVVLSDYSSLSHSETDGEDEDDSAGDEADGEDRSSATVSGFTTIKQAAQSLGAPASNAKLKRQVSMRKHHHHFIRHKSASLVGKTGLAPPPSSVVTRSPLPVHRASVDFTKIKQRKLFEESSIIFPESTGITVEPLVGSDSSIVPPPSSLQSENKDVMSSSAREKELSAAYRRLTKFRRKSRRNMTTTAVIGDSSLDTVTTAGHHSHHHYQLTAKCTSILFDDPFNPPGSSHRHHHHYHHHHHRRHMESLEIDQEDGLLLQSGTEDECDPYDMTIKSKQYFGGVGGGGGVEKPTIKITECPDFPEDKTPDKISSLIGDISRLQIAKPSSSSKSDSEQSPSKQFTPFVPSFPTGKSFLSQTFYPEAITKKELLVPPTSPGGAAGGKMKTSLSDTTLAISQVVKPAAPPRRSSVTYLANVNNSSNSNSGGVAVAATRNKLQATGNTIVVPPNSGGGGGTTPSSSRRRVSWTGTLTVSVPTTTAAAASIPMVAQPSNKTGGGGGGSLYNQRKKSFRKSKSLNDKQQEGGGGTSSLSVVPNSSSSSSADKTRAIGVSRSSRLISHSNTSTASSITPAITVTPSSSNNAKKKRGKLKRTKHNK